MARMSIATISLSRRECQSAADLQDLPPDTLGFLCLATGGGAAPPELPAPARALLLAALRVLRPGGLLFIHGEPAVAATKAGQRGNVELGKCRGGKHGD